MNIMYNGFKTAKQVGKRKREKGLTVAGTLRKKDRGLDPIYSQRPSSASTGER